MKLVAILAITFLTALQCYSSKVTVKTTDFLTAAKMLGIATVIGSGIFYYCSLSTGKNAKETIYRFVSLIEWYAQLLSPDTVSPQS